MQTDPPTTYAALHIHRLLWSQKPTPALLALVLKPTALLSLPDVVVSVLALHSSVGFCTTYKVLSTFTFIHCYYLLESLYYAFVDLSIVLSQEPGSVKLRRLCRTWVLL